MELLIKKEAVMPLTLDGVMLASWVEYIRTFSVLACVLRVEARYLLCPKCRSCGFYCAVRWRNVNLCVRRRVDYHE